MSPCAPKSMLRGAALAALLLLAGCASAPPGPPPEIRRLEDQLARLHDDPRVAPNAQSELQDADAAVDALARNLRRLDDPMFQHGVYIADRLVRIAEATGLARYEEQRGADLGAERERLAARSGPFHDATRPVDTTRALGREPFGRTENGDLAAIQSRLSGLESHLDGRGLVITLGDFMFERDAALREPAMRSLDTLATALRGEPPASLSIEPWAGPADDDRDLAARRAASVRRYLAGRGVDADTPAIRDVRAARDRGHVDIVVRIARR